jgi:hypothetical protein
MMKTKSTTAHEIHECFGLYAGSKTARIIQAAVANSTRILNRKFLPVMNGKTRLGEKCPSATISGTNRMANNPPIAANFNSTTEFWFFIREFARSTR